MRMEFAYSGCSLGKGGTLSLHIDGNKVGEGAVGATAAMASIPASHKPQIGYLRDIA